MADVSHFVQAHGALKPGPMWVGEHRTFGLAQLQQTGFPGKGDEDWKYTNASKLVQTAYVPASGSLDALPDRAIVGAVTLVLVDGRFSAALSSLESVPAGVRIAPLSAVDGQGVGDLLGVPDGFDALNAAFLTDGALIEIDAKADVSEPLHLVHVTTGGEGLNAVRVVVRAGASSRATVVEHWLGDGASLTTAVSELHLAANSELRHIRIQDEDRTDGHHVGTVLGHQERDSRWTSYVLTLGAAISRVDIRSHLAGEGAEVDLQGLYLLKDDQHADHHTHIDHAVPHTVSREQYKGILDDTSRGVFTGRVLVQKDAQKIDSSQANHNLVLSDTAVANSRPQLEIFADDVKCAHGATIGRLDPEASFYLRSRGLTELESRSLLTFAFANEILSHLPEGSVRDQLADRVRGWLEAT